ncbi:MAG TPA: hypothetical protein VH854_10050 [Thermoanaerobaculia bacterium]|nr:hypothetical protein [Thermoanaerobaculia bacterium]
MSFRSREEYEAWKRRAGTPPPVSPSAPIPPEASEPGEIALRLSPLYGVLILAAGAVFAVLGLGRFGKAGPTFYTLCLAAGLVAILGGVWLLRRRGIIVRMTSSALHLREVAIPWREIRSVERVRDGRRYWVGICLTTPRTDLDDVALKARAVLRAMRSPGAECDYSILETDLPRSTVWFVEECRRRMAAAAR